MEMNINMRLMTCCNCGISFAVPQSYYNELFSIHKTFYCPSGHPQYFTAETKEEKLKQQLNQCHIKIEYLTDDTSYLSNSNRSLRGVITRQKKAINKRKI